MAYVYRHSARDIVNEFGIKYINDIRRVLVGERKYHKGMIFKYNSHEA